MTKQSHLLFEAPFNLEVSLPKRFPNQLTVYSRPTDAPCSSPGATTLTNWGRYSDQITPEHQRSINHLANLIVSSFAQSACPPFRQVQIIGHADKDWQGPKKETQVSFDRAMAVRKALIASVKQLWAARGMGLPPKGGVEWYVEGKGTKNMIAPPYTPANRRVVVTLIRTGLPIPPRHDWRQAIQRGLNLLKRQPLAARQTKRLQCLLKKVSEPGVVDAYLLFDSLVRNQVACLPAPTAVSLLKRVRGDLGMRATFGPEIPDDDFIKNLVRIDQNIVEGIRKIDEHLQVNGIAADCFKRQMNNWISANQRDPKSIYWCYGTNQP